jgi:hypothetical protein
MIIFDLDGTLADCEHRRHFIQDPIDYCHNCYQLIKIMPNNPQVCGKCNRDPFNWKCDWKSFFEACYEDKPIEPAIITMRRHAQHDDIQIWSGRCESVKDKTINWIYDKIPAFAPRNVIENHILKMRPKGNTEPDEVIKERWLDDALEQGENIDFVFDDRPKVVRMWRRRGIFVFNCCQHDEEF